MCNEGDNERYYSGLETQGQFRYRYRHPPKPRDSYTYSRSHPWGGLKSSLLLSFFFSSLLLMSSASHFFPFNIQFAIRDGVWASCQPHGHLFYFNLLLLLLLCLSHTFLLSLPSPRSSTLFKGDRGRSSVRRVVFWCRSLDTPRTTLFSWLHNLPCCESMQKLIIPAEDIKFSPVSVCRLDNYCGVGGNNYLMLIHKTLIKDGPGLRKNWLIWGFDVKTFESCKLFKLVF